MVEAAVADVDSAPAPDCGSATAPPAAGRIEVTHLAKRFGAVRAIDDLSFVVEPGQVCGFLGPNGAGKTTTLRCILGLVTPTGGRATIGGLRYADLPQPLMSVGAMLDASSFYPGRSARNHLRVLCAAAGLADARVDEVLALTGLTEPAGRRVAGFSTGMRQRLGLAAALLGDPGVLVLDEPATGLDPAGINWLRDLLRYLAHDRNKTVLVSSHLLTEMEHTADRIVIIAAGKLVREGSLQELISNSAAIVRVRTPLPEILAIALREQGFTVDRDDELLVVRGADPATVGHVAFTAHVEVHELTGVQGDLEDVFLELTNGVVGSEAAEVVGTGAAP